MAFSLFDRRGAVDGIEGPTRVTVGVFDGVHRGHLHLLSQMRHVAQVKGGEEWPTVVITLTSHPSFVLGRRASEYWLDDPEEHLRLLFEGGADYVAVLPFTVEVARLTACQMARMLYDELNMRMLLLGYDSRFGSKQNDDFALLPELASTLGFALERGEPFLVGGQPISSSRIRESLMSGNVGETAALLGRHYAVSGQVLHGRGVGHTLGFPTANVDLAQTRKMLPGEGVYAVRMKNEELGMMNCGMANLGSAPTFGVEKPLLEVHLIDFEGDLYGETVTVEFMQRLRDIRRFDTPEALEAQLQKDLRNCLELIQ